MRTSKLTVAGAFLLLCGALTAIGLQVFGPGLVTTRPAPAPRQATTMQALLSRWRQDRRWCFI